MSIITKTSLLSTSSCTCMFEYVMAFTSVPCGCLFKSNVSPKPRALMRKFTLSNSRILIVYKNAIISLLIKRASVSYPWNEEGLGAEAE